MNIGRRSFIRWQYQRVERAWLWGAQLRTQGSTTTLQLRRLWGPTVSEHPLKWFDIGLGCVVFPIYINHNVATQKIVRTHCKFNDLILSWVVRIIRVHQWEMLIDPLLLKDCSSDPPDSLTVEGSNRVAQGETVVLCCIDWWYLIKLHPENGSFSADISE